ncbi:sirohydrochlorin cobaltochelatase [Psychrilyobacter atlanticus]|uniref:sirohydrochlorin cobaltochelatase n=1 Tax=Psychrilyobacter atlanticus TaxID=271091 RepID=UPI0004189B50|nr:sirohydrochlorin cobaltochelatase [Psychrilyobacter atlanticus]
MVLAEKKEGRIKRGILLVHFGTSRKKARENSLETINKRIEKEFKEFEIREAYTSRMIIKKIFKEEGIRKLTPNEAIKKMKEEGFTHIIVQATHIINGIEADCMKQEVDEYKGEFKEIKIGSGLLTQTKDYMDVADIFNKEYSDRPIVLIGHGTDHHAASAYGMLQYTIQKKGYKHIFVGTVEGYPGLEEVMEDLEMNGIKEATLVPLMVVAGVHAEEDIAGDWKEALEEKGIGIEVSMIGMGERREVQDLFIDHIDDLIKFEVEDIKKKKENILKGENNEN